MRVLTLLVALLTATLTYAQDNIILRNGREISAKVLEVNQQDLKYRKTDNPDGPMYTAPVRDVLLIKYANGTKDSFDSQSAPATGTGSTQTVTVTVGKGDVSGTMNTSAGLSALRYQSRFLNHYFVDATGQRLRLNETESVLRLQPDALTAFDRGRSLRTWSTITGVTAAAFVGVALADRGGLFRHDRFIDGPGNDPYNPGNNGGRLEGRGPNHRVGAALVGGGILVGFASVWLQHRATINFRRAANRYNQRPATSLHLSPASSGIGMGLALRF